MTGSKDAFSISHRMAGIEGFYSTLVATCFFNAFLLFTALVLNIITIQALRKIPSFPKPLKTFLISLAVSDLGVGLLVHPLHIARLLTEVESANQRLYNTVYTAHGLFANLLCTASFLGIFALTVDRFLAIHLHLRYREPVTYRRVVAVVISVWVFSSCISLFVLNGILENVLDIITITSGAVCLTTTGLVYCKIYSIVHHHTNQHALQLSSIAGSITESEWRNGKCCKAEKNWTCYILHVCPVFGLSSTLPLRQNCYSNAWRVCLADTSASLFNDTGVSKFIPQSSDLLLEDEKHSASCDECTS